MEDNILITKYVLRKFNYKNIHSAGPELYFYNPCIGYIKKGYARFLYKGKSIYAYEGDLIYIAHGTKYQSIWFGSPDIEWYSVGFRFKTKYDFNKYSFQILRGYPSELFDKMFETYESSCMLSVSYFYRLLDDVYKKLKTSFPTVSYKAIQPALEYIEKNYNKDFSINTLAEVCHCSESGLFKLFKKSVGVTPVVYKHNIMIQHAIDLLANTDISIEEISNMVGFSSSNYFRKIFMKLTDKTPRELRRKKGSV